MTIRSSLRGASAAIAATILASAALLFSSQLALAQFSQQGPKLVGTPAPGGAQQQGNSVSLSSDGNTAIVGGPGDDPVGAAWVYTRSGGVWTQQGGKLVGTGAIEGTGQGFSVALSSDGNTAIVGGPNDDFSDPSGVGAAWVFTRSGGVWTQQGSKLVGTGAIGFARQGSSVALSSDGNTAIVGGPSDNANVDDDSVGAAWVYTRSGGVWTQQGGKLVGTGAIGFPRQGSSVALSSDGNTAIVGGPLDDIRGAAWVFTRSGGVWTQQGSKLVGTGAIPAAQQGTSVALSSDGNTAIVGGPSDNGSAGAAWVFTRSGGVWTQQGSKLVGTGAIPAAQPHAQQGTSVALSSDGNTAIVGGPFDDFGDGSAGAVWVYTRNGGVWTQQGSKLVGTGGLRVSIQLQGWSVALSSDGNTAMVGGPGENNFVGAAWVYVATACRVSQLGDFNGGGTADIPWRHNTGATAIWLMNGTQVVTSPVIASVPVEWHIVGIGDFNADGKADIVWRHNDGSVAIWFMNGTQVVTSPVIASVPVDWRIVGVADFNADGMADIVWRHNDGSVAIWLMNGTQVASSPVIASVPVDWHIVGLGDFNADGKADIVWRHNDGSVAIWLMNGTQVASNPVVGSVPVDWRIVGVGDFDADGKADIVWRHNDGSVAVWFMNGTQVVTSPVIASVPLDWRIVGLGDFNADAKADIVWRHNDGSVAIWLMNGTQVASSPVIANVSIDWGIINNGNEPPPNCN